MEKPMALRSKTGRELENKSLTLFQLMKTVAIIAAAGSGERLGSKTPKPYLKLNGKPLLAYSLEIFSRTKEITQIVLVVDKKFIKKAEKIVQGVNNKKIKAVVAGGKTRTESVYNGYSILDKDTDLVLVHDAARPFVTPQIIKDCIRQAVEYKAVVCAVPCVSTIKQVDQALKVVDTLDRNVLWQVQTPQGFSYQLLGRAYKAIDVHKESKFDDAALVEKINHPVKIFMGSAENIKITTKDDLRMAKAILNMKGSGK